MDLIDQLGTNKPHRSGLAKRLARLEEHENFDVSGTGFLFGNNSLLNRVRNRLDGNESSGEQGLNAQFNDVRESNLPPTQIFTPTYDGEDLEQDFSQKKTSIELARSEKAAEARAVETVRENGFNPEPLSVRQSDIPPKPTTQWLHNETQPVERDQRERSRETGDELDTQVLQTEIDAGVNGFELDPTVADPEPTAGTNLEQTITDHTRVDKGDFDTHSQGTDISSRNSIDLSGEVEPHNEHPNEHVVFERSANNPSKSSATRDFVNAFDEDSDNSSSDQEESTPHNVSTALSSLGTADAVVNEGSEQRKDHLKLIETSHQKDMIHEEPKALKLYHGMLRQKIDVTKNVDLSSDSEGEGEHGSRSLSSRAAVLELKARLSKKKRLSTLKRTDSSTNSESLKCLFHSLRKANKEQILEHQKDQFQLKGLDLTAIAEEKESVESLLERELARNRKIRLRELRKEKEADFQETDDNLSGELSLSGNELDLGYSEGEQSNKNDSDVESTNASGEVPEAGRYPDTDTDVQNAAKDTEKQTNERDAEEKEEEDEDEDEEQEQEQEQEEEEEEEEEEVRMLRPNKRGHIVHSLSEDEDQGVDQLATRRIDLGSYGNNLLSTDTPSRDELSLRIGVGEKTDDANAFKSVDQNHFGTEAVTEDAFRAIMKKLIKKRQEQEQKRERQIREMRKSKVNHMLEIEAEESDDEWHGIGGIDGEGSDGYDSELENMIDDYSNSNFNPDEIRKKLIEEDITKDKDLVNKILHDIENGGFRKRGRGALDIEFSDDEDEELLKYHARRKQLLKKKISGSAELNSISTNPKSKAFFDSLQEDFEGRDRLFDDETLKAEQNTTSFRKAEEEVPLKESKQKMILSEDFVQRTLSFLTSQENGTESAPELDKLDVEKNYSTQEHDLFSLKQSSSIKGFTTFTREIDHNVNDDENVFPGRNGASLVSRFGHHQEANEKFKEGQKTVQMKKTYKMAGCTRASVTYLGRARQLKARKTARPRLGAKPKTVTRKSTLLANSSSSFDN
ncbi:LADA_0H00276g1_1 [Lachancea dasiensis]|uniref:LADA_0H00276g1_1 n=1 Tax=Lachancea dasiensis TaxID=1072105 RepID=A0A1G4JYZ2_9SACH|nr:LADA_0H00276g1_1 [Lachancea dasiensis]